MSVRILDEMRAHEEFPERLSLHLSYGNGIANFNRFSIEHSVEQLFRSWIWQKFTERHDTNAENPSAAADFRRAVGIALESVDWQPGMSGLTILPSLVLTGVKSGSMKEDLVVGIILLVLQVPAGVATNVLTDIARPHEAQALQVGKTVLIKSESTLQQFVVYLKGLQSQASHEGAYLDTKTVYEIYSLYKSISNVAGGEISVTVTTSDGHSITFELTAKEAAKQLPGIERRLFGGPIRP